MFHSMVRPVRQPKLTSFCTELTSIAQTQLIHQPTIEEVMDHFGRWCAEYQVNAHNTSVATCGDWDLRVMWPKQVRLAPLLKTPALFKRWCNLKVIFKRYTQCKAKGMMSLLQYANIPHQGRHHRGIDDVNNLSEFVVWALGQGWAFYPTQYR